MTKSRLLFHAMRHGVNKINPINFIKQIRSVYSECQPPPTPVPKRLNSTQIRYLCPNSEKYQSRDKMVLRVFTIYLTIFNNSLQEDYGHINQKPTFYGRFPKLKFLFNPTFWTREQGRIKWNKSDDPFWLISTWNFVFKVNCFVTGLRLRISCF